MTVRVASARRKILTRRKRRCVQSAVRPSLRRGRCRRQQGVRDGKWPAHVVRKTSPPCQPGPVTVAVALRISSLDSIVMRGQSTPHCSRQPVRGFRARSAAAPDQRSGGTGAGSRQSAQRSHPAIRLVVGPSRRRPFDRRPPRSHPGGRGPAAVWGPASAAGSSSKAPRRGRLMCSKRRWSADELTSPGAPGLASLVLTHPGSTRPK